MLFCVIFVQIKQIKLDQAINWAMNHTSVINATDNTTNISMPISYQTSICMTKKKCVKSFFINKTKCDEMVIFQWSLPFVQMANILKHVVLIIKKVFTRSVTVL